MRAAEASAGELKHCFARINTIDIDLWIGAHELAKETAVALTQDQCASWARDRVDPVSSGSLQRIAKSDCLEPAIMPCDKIEAHKTFSATNKASGVKRTMSARALRSSRDTRRKCSAPNKRLLAPTHNITGQAPGSNRQRKTDAAGKKRGAYARKSSYAPSASRLNACPEFDRAPVPRSQC